MAQFNLSDPGNTLVPAYLALKEKGYVVTNEFSLSTGVDCWIATGPLGRFEAKDMISLLGVVALAEVRGTQWQASDKAIEEFLAEFKQLYKFRCEGTSFIKNISLRPWSEELSKTTRTFPDYIIHRIAMTGFGCVEAARTDRQQDITWQFTSRDGVSQVLATSPNRYFRSIIGPWAIDLGVDPYCGHTLFDVNACPNWPSQGTYRFSFYTCNQPNMGVWIKLILWNIDLPPNS